MRVIHGLIHHQFTRSLRMLSTKPWFSITVIGTLALGIAGNSAVFSVFNSLFLRPLPFVELERLLDLDETASQWNLVHVGVSNPDLYQGRTSVQTMVDKLDGSLWTRQAYSWLFGVFAMVAISLGVAGIYGTGSHGVAQRTREIGLRMALGARRDQVLAQVLLGGARTSTLGVTAGLLGALGATNWLRSLLFGVNSRDPLIYASVVLGILSVALLASTVPARRAAKVDPVVALRSE